MTKINIKKRKELTAGQLNKILGSDSTINLTDKKYKKDYKSIFRIIWSVFLLSLILITTVKAIYIDFKSLERDSDTMTPKTMTGTLISHLNWNGRNLSLTVYGDQLEEMKARGYSNTRILDLLSIKSQECNAYKGCIGIKGLDIGPFQINKIHTKQYNESYKLWNSKQYGQLYNYQLTFANNLIESYHTRFCGEEIFSLIGKEYSNEARLKCVAISYNGGPDRWNYAKKVWLKRQIISDYLFEEGYLIIEK